MPLARVTVQRQREMELRRYLREMRHGDRQVQGRRRRRRDRRVRHQGRQRRLSAGSRDAGRGRQRSQRSVRPQAEVPAPGPDRSDDAARPSGACARIRTSRTRRRGAGRTSSTSTPSRPARRSTARNTRTGRTLPAAFRQPDGRPCGHRLTSSIVTHGRDSSAPRGFTLIELLVVISMISILAAMGVVQYRNSVQRTQEATLRTTCSRCAT